MSAPSPALAAFPVPDLPAEGAAEGLSWRRNLPPALDPLSGWFTDAEDMLRVHPLARFPFAPDEWAELLVRPGLLFVYALDAEGAPFAHFGLRDNAGAAHLCFLVMDPARRGAGMSRLLIRLTAAVARLAAPGATRMTLYVNNANRRAERLYLGLGFARNGVTQDDMFQMERPLGLTPPWGADAPRPTS
ncbi:MAG: GNAT family N-acetyltransferase [Pseudomonadota bacterium]|nr:GNAT family N-acetyltransferase [Pseudomonadota bacterium]MEE3099840.1 GNAT family N-acetyltransferase [Pseudomonadota bacterium]